MARHNNEPRMLEVPKRNTKEAKLLFVVIILQVLNIIVHFIKV